MKNEYKSMDEHLHDEFVENLKKENAKQKEMIGVLVQGLDAVRRSFMELLGKLPHNDMLKKAVDLKVKNLIEKAKPFL